MSFGLPAGGIVRGISYLALGNFNTVKAEIEAALRARGPFGHVDVPAASSVYHHGGNPIPVAGWVLDTTHIGQVSVQIDGSDVATIPVNASRPDVCAVYPAYDGCPQVGFSGSAPPPTGPCPRLLRVVARDNDGNVQVLGERVVAP